MAATFTNTTNCIKKAGTHANSTIIADTTTLTEWIEHAESYIISRTFIDFRTSYSSLSTELKDMLDDCTSSLVAMRIIAWDTTGYITRESDILLNLNDGIVETLIKGLQNYMKNPLSQPTGLN